MEDERITKKTTDRLKKLELAASTMLTTYDPSIDLSEVQLTTKDADWEKQLKHLVRGLKVYQRVKMAILCGKQVCKAARWNKWADNWLSGKTSSVRSCERMYEIYVYEASQSSRVWTALSATYTAESSLRPAPTQSREHCTWYDLLTTCGDAKKLCNHDLDLGGLLQRCSQS